MIALIEAGHIVEGRLEEALAAVGLSSAKYRLLEQLVGAGEPITLTRLAEGLGCVRSNITQLVDRLEGDGLVRRVDDPSDRRSIRVQLTPEGEARQREGAEVMARITAEVAAVVSERDHLALCRVLSALR